MSTTRSAAELIEIAAALIRPYQAPGGALFGRVACAMVADNGEIFTGVNLEVPCDMGFCAEHAAAAAMVATGVYRFTEVVAARRSATGELVIPPPCGRCREFLRQLDPGNLDAIVILGADTHCLLSELLPMPYQSSGTLRGLKL